jgi:hypothetical protein
MVLISYVRKKMRPRELLSDRFSTRPGGAPQHLSSLLARDVPKYLGADYQRDVVSPCLDLRRRRENGGTSRGARSLVPTGR